MSVTISADDPRTIRAIEIAAEADQWLVYRDADGHEAFGIPSQSAPNRYYLVTPASCDCPDFARNGLSAAAPGETGAVHACKHMLAVRLHLELARAQQHAALRARQRHRDQVRLIPTPESVSPSV